MKKLMIACAAALAAFAAAQAADVTSANIVGTQTITLKGTGSGVSGYNMIAINWEAVGGDTINLQDLFSADDLAKMAAGTIAQKMTADRIMVWNAASDSYTTYYLRKQNNGTILGWAGFSDNAVAASVPVAKGSAFWFYRQAAADIEVTIKGEVSDDASVSFAIKGNANCSGYNMIGAGFPIDFMLNAAQFAWTTGAAGTIAQKMTADRIMVWDATSDSYTTYYLRKQNNGTILGWAGFSDNAVDANAKIPAGGAAWYYRQTAADTTATEATPLN